jgi:hypothetical protein
MSDDNARVVKLSGKRDSYGPAWRRPDGLLVDLRVFTSHAVEDGYELEKVFRPEELEKLGIDQVLIDQAGQSDPPGFLLMP